MGEIQQVIGLVREVDRAVAHNPDLKQEVADLLAPLDVEAPSDVESLPDVDSALAAMAAEAPPPRLRNRRLLAIAGLIRTSPERFGREGLDRRKVVAALQPSMRDSRLRQAEDAFELLSRSKPYTGRGAACELLSQTIELGLVDARLHTSLHLVPIGAGDRNAAARVAIFVPVPGITCDDVDELLEPTSWPRLNPVWASMQPVDGRPDTLSTGQRRLYQEVFTVTPRLQLTPVLEFVRQDLTSDRAARSLEYRLAAKQKQSPGELIQVDGGSLVIRVVDHELHITTTKRVLFAPPFDGPGLVMVTDNVGYLEAFEKMVVAAISKCDGRSP
jgi:hypothetical protein